jgi:transposase
MWSPLVPCAKTVNNIITRFNEYGDYETERNGRRRRWGRITPEHFEFLRCHLLEVNSELYLDEMQQLLYDKFQVRYRTTLICTTLIRHKITRKKLEFHAKRRCAHEREVFRAVIITAGVQAHHILFIDETRCDPPSEKRRYGRGTRGARVAREAEFTRAARGFSALGVMSVNGGMVACSITNVNGALNILPASPSLERIIYQFVCSSVGVTAAQFIDDVANVLVPLLNPFPMINSVVVLDNAIIHHHPAVRAMIEATGALLFFLPA